MTSYIFLIFILIIGSILLFKFYKWLVFKTIKAFKGLKTYLCKMITVLQYLGNMLLIGLMVSFAISSLLALTSIPRGVLLGISIFVWLYMTGILLCIEQIEWHQKTYKIQKAMHIVYLLMSVIIPFLFFMYLFEPQHLFSKIILFALCVVYGVIGYKYGETALKVYSLMRM